MRNLFVTDEYQPTGTYRVRFSKGGLWREVTIDDYFPCYQGKGPVFSRGVGDELWVLILEKAYAKLHGSYYSLRGGLAFEGLMDLTGACVLVHCVLLYAGGGGAHHIHNLTLHTIFTTSPSRSPPHSQPHPHPFALPLSPLSHSSHSPPLP